MTSTPEANRNNLPRGFTEALKESSEIFRAEISAATPEASLAVAGAYQRCRAIAEENKLYWAGKCDPLNPTDPSKAVYRAKSAACFQVEMDIAAATPTDTSAVERGIVQPSIATKPTSSRTETSATETAGWQLIETAPKDGSKVDLLYPHPRGRTNDCFWQEGGVYGDGGWYWLTPSWDENGLEPESDWSRNSYPNMDPTHWMRPPAPPDARNRSESTPPAVLAAPQPPVEGLRELLSERVRNCPIRYAPFQDGSGVLARQIDIAREDIEEAVLAALASPSLTAGAKS